MWECPIRSGTHKSTHTHQVMQSTSPLLPAQWTLPHCDVTEGHILKRLNNMTPSGKMWRLISLRAPSYLEVSKYLSCLSFPVLSRFWRYIFISRRIYCPVSLSILLFHSLLSPFFKNFMYNFRHQDLLTA